MNYYNIVHSTISITQAINSLAHFEKTVIESLDNNDLNYALLLTEAGLDKDVPSLTEILSYLEITRDKMTELLMRKLNHDDPWQKLSPYCFTFGGQNTFLLDHIDKMRELYTPILDMIPFGEMYNYAEYFYKESKSWGAPPLKVDVRASGLNNNIPDFITVKVLKSVDYSLLNELYVGICHQLSDFLYEEKSIRSFLQSPNPIQIEQDEDLWSNLLDFFSQTIAYMLVHHVDEKINKERV